MVSIKIFKAENLVFDKPVCEIEHCNINQSYTPLRESPFGPVKVSFFYSNDNNECCSIWAHNEDEQRIVFSDSDTLLKEIKIKSDMYNHELRNLFNTVIQPYYSHVKTVSAVDKL